MSSRPRGKGSRMLKGLGLNYVLEPRIPTYNTEPFCQRKISGLKRPSVDQKALRRSSRAEARKCVLYNQKIHPQDHLLPYRRAVKNDDDFANEIHLQNQRATLDAMSDDDSNDSNDDCDHDDDDDDDDDDDSNGSAYDSAVETLPKDDIATAMSRRANEHKRPSVRTPEATRRRSGRTHHTINYDCKRHPNDADIGWPGRKPTHCDSERSTQRSGYRLSPLEDGRSMEGLILDPIISDWAPQQDRKSSPEASSESAYSHTLDDERSRSNTLDHQGLSYFDRAGSLELGSADCDWPADDELITNALSFAGLAAQPELPGHGNSPLNQPAGGFTMGNAKDQLQMLAHRQQTAQQPATSSQLLETERTHRKEKSKPQRR